MTRIPTPEGHSAPATYNDFLGRQQTQVKSELAAISVNKLHKVAAAATTEESELDKFAAGE